MTITYQGEPNTAMPLLPDWPSENQFRRYRQRDQTIPAVRMKCFTLPNLGPDLPDAERVQYRNRESDSVDQALFFAEPARVTVEVLSPQVGIIAHLPGAPAGTRHTDGPLLECESGDSARCTPGRKFQTEQYHASLDDFIISAPGLLAHQARRPAPAVHQLTRRLNTGPYNISCTLFSPRGAEQAASPNRGVACESR